MWVKKFTYNGGGRSCCQIYIMMHLCNSKSIGMGAAEIHFFELRPRGAVIYMGARGDHCTHLTNLFQMGGQQPTSMLMLALNWKPTTARVPTQN